MPEKQSVQERITLGVSQNGIAVWYNAVSSHAATHIADTPNLKDLATEITGRTSLTNDYAQFHTDMGYTIGASDLVATQPGDKIVYAKRLNRDSYSVFNMSRQPEPSSLVTTAYEKQPDGTYELVSAWVGPSDSPSLPGTDRETPESKEFWAHHALAWGAQAIQESTLTETCPW